ncbi:MAG: PHP domain-containing protein, partial [Planctomycetota bacterium]
MSKTGYDDQKVPQDLRENFVHLHCHSHYSFLDGGVEVEKLVARAAEWNMPAVALTDHGVMCGAMDLYSECKKRANPDGSWTVKPIIGTEAYICDDHTKRKKDSTHHLLLLAANEEGYKNLVKLNAASHASGYYYKPRIDLDLLAAHHHGLIVTSACLAGEVAQACASGHFDEAEKVIGTYRDIFGDRYYLEVQNHDIDDERKAAHGKLAIAKKLGIPFIATNDSHYLDQSDYRAHDALLCICTGANVSDMRRFRFENDSFWFKDQQSMWDTFPPEMREGLYRTKEIADRCNVKFKFG